MELSQLADDFATGLKAADQLRPIAINRRTKEPFQPGIGPHSEEPAIRLVLEEMRNAHPARYSSVAFGINYPNISRQKCDLSISQGTDELFIECKLLRMLGDNGKLNDNMLMHILSPYPQHRSALTDCEKLRTSGFEGRKAVLIFGYEGDDWPLEPAITAFELLAGRDELLGTRHSATYSGLCHPVHQSGAVYLWEILPTVS